jgi:hypothetical protein
MVWPFDDCVLCNFLLRYFDGIAMDGRGKPLLNQAKLIVSSKPADSAKDLQNCA